MPIDELQIKFKFCKIDVTTFLNQVEQMLEKNYLRYICFFIGEMIKAIFDENDYLYKTMMITIKDMDQYLL